MSTFRLSPAHVQYLEHVERRPFGSSTHDQIRHAVKRLLAGKLRVRRLTQEYQQSGRAFVCYGQERMRIKFSLTVREGRALCGGPEVRKGETTLEALIRAHGERYGYAVSHHQCDKWCGSDCPGQRKKSA
jgi:hypothetical protein